MSFHVHFVCTGNICRSPMAEGLLRHAVGGRDCDDVIVSSSGTWAYEDGPATPLAVDAAQALGASIEPHRSRATDTDVLASADLVVAMTSVHVRELLELMPEVADKLVLMKEIPEIDPVSVPVNAPREKRLAAFLEGERPAPRRALDVDDPMGMPAHVYDRCAAEIKRAMAPLVDLICPP